LQASELQLLTAYRHTEIGVTQGVSRKDASSNVTTVGTRSSSLWQPRLAQSVNEVLGILGVLVEGKKSCCGSQLRLANGRTAIDGFEAFHQRVLNNLKLACSVFMSGDVRMARILLEEKVGLRNAELTASESHLRRLREGRPESIETSSLHLDVLRDLKRIHSHICSVAYPVLEVTGELQPNRLKESEKGLLSAPDGSATGSSAP
jgi:hypothetical protein